MSNHNTPFSQQIAYMGRGTLEAELTEELAAGVFNVLGSVSA